MAILNFQGHVIYWWTSPKERKDNT